MSSPVDEYAYGDGPFLEERTEPQSRSAALRFTLVVSAVVLALLAHYFIRSGEIKWAIVPLVLAVGCLFLALGRDAHTWVTNRVRSSGETPCGRDGNRVETGLGVLGAIVGLVLLYVSLRNFGHEEIESLALAWWSFGAAVVVGLGAIPAMEGRWTELTRRLWAPGGLRIDVTGAAPWLALAGILVLAAGLRLYNLDDVPAGLWYDEADNIFHARQHARDPGQIPVYAASTNLPSMFLLPIAAVVKLAGVSITTARLVAVGFGLLGIVATFLLVRVALGATTGLIATFLVAVMRWDINWSRIGMHGITGVLFAALMGWLTLRAVRSGRASDYAYAGASVGLGMWFYTSVRLFPLVLGAILLHHLLMDRPPIRGFLLRVCLMAVVAFLVAAPVVQFASTHPDEFFGRTRATSLFELTPREQWADVLGTSLVRHSLMFSQRGDPNPRHNLPDAPMLDFITGSMFVLGFFFALTRRRNVAVFSLPFWVLLMVLPGVLTVPWESPQSLRSILVIPAVAGLAALAIHALWRVCRDAPWYPVRRFALPGLLALLGLIAYQNVDFYFGDQAGDPRVFAAFSTDETLMARSQVEQQRRGYSLWVSRQFLFGLTGTLLADHPRYEVIRAPETLPIDSTQVWRGAAVYFEPRESGFWNTMRAYYPDADYQVVTPPGGGEPLYYAGFVSREELEANQGLGVVYSVAGEPVDGAENTVSDAVWHAYDGPSRYPYDVTISGSLHVPEEGVYTLVLDSRSQVSDLTVSLDGRPVLGGGKMLTKIDPAAGLHHLEIWGRVEGPEGGIRLLWVPPGGERHPVPFGRLYRSPVKPVGLVGEYYSGARSPGMPDEVQVTPSMDLFHYDPVIPEPYTAIWEGELDVGATGFYGFKASRRGPGTVQLYINDQLVVREPQLEGVESTGEVGLTAGRHDVRVVYEPESPPSQFEILWSVSGGRFEPIPVESLIPDPGRMFRVVE